jgi:hypothetical protein
LAFSGNGGGKGVNGGSNELLQLMGKIDVIGGKRIFCSVKPPGTFIGSGGEILLLLGCRYDSVDSEV